MYNESITNEQRRAYEKHTEIFCGFDRSGCVGNEELLKLKTELQQIDRQYYGGAMIEADLAAAKAHLQSSLWS